MERNAFGVPGIAGHAVASHRCPEVVTSPPPAGQHRRLAQHCWCSGDALFAANGVGAG